MRFDPLSLTELHLEEGRRLQRVYRRRGLSAEEAEDLVQEAFLRLAQPPPEEIREPGAYLRRIAENLFFDALRRARRSREVFPAEARLSEEIADPQPSVEAALIAREAEEALDRALAELPPRCREVVRLHKFEGLSYVEIAQRMGVSRNTVMVHMVRGLGALRRRLGGAEDGAPEEED
ncbi:RNA polymerase sigma factor [Neomegalonema sp.]|uniref:RNA polymerase sigma factor n=1 Tax=Neomegalonema sp. TaxID=2039713 RepID=UPI0026149C93|nr:RNA polymerase sigma factor [Neomegalonema sp.]MDD2867810.1 RNA polymerase sigma factor [Neomegalonema sp.]